MYRENFECIDCSGTYSLKHDMDRDYYIVKYCPFCGSENDEELESYDNDEDFDEE